MSEDFDIEHPDAPASFEEDAQDSEPRYWLKYWRNQ